MVSLIIPAYNEAETIEKTIVCALEFFCTSAWESELILVDDGSTDDTKSVMERYVKDGVRVLSYPKNRGKGFALRLGVEKSKGDFVFFTDADMAYGFSYIGQALCILQQGQAQAVVGSRRIGKGGYENYGILRKMMSGVFSLLANSVLKLHLSDTQCGFKGFTGECAREIFGLCKTDRFGIDFELLYLARCFDKKIVELPVRIINHAQTSVHPVRDSVRMIGELFAVKCNHREKFKEDRQWSKQDT